MFKYLSKFLYILAENRSKLIPLLLAFILTSMLETIGIGLIGPFVGLATSPESIQHNSFLTSAYKQFGLSSERQFISLIGVFIVLIFYIKSFISFRVQSFIFKFSFTQQARLSQKLLHAYLTVPYTFHLKINSANLIQNIISESDKFSNGIMIPLLVTTANIFVLVFLISLLFKTSLVAMVVILIIGIVVFFIFQVLKHKVEHWGKEAYNSYTEMIRIINHSLGGLKETRIIGCEPYFEKQISGQAQRFANAATSLQSFNISPRILIEALLVTFLVGFISIYLIFTNKNTQDLNSTLGIFAIASIRIIPAISNSISAINTLKSNSYSLQQLYFDLKELEKVELSERKASKSTFRDSSIKKIVCLKNQIVLNQISYCYPGASEPAIKNISLTINKGQSIAFIGKSGAGKTTLVDIILGLLTVESGDITVDGRSIYENLRSWQNLIGYIPQSIFLMDDTIEKNIAFGVPEELIDSERMSKALQAAQLEELIVQLPDGIKTTVGERGVRLSGGQRQRIGIARALYHEREVLVLDEATAALDNETESLINKAIKSLSGTKTIIIIAHRLTTVEHCDCIYLMEKGRVVKSGSYKEVVLREQSLH